MLVYYFSLFRGVRLCRELSACVVNGVGRVEDQLGDRYNGVAIVDKAGEDGRQGLRRVQRGVVEQDDAPWLHLGCHPLAYRVRIVVLPVEGVPIGNDLKPLCRKGLRVWRLCALGKNLTCKRGVLQSFQARERSKLKGCARGEVVGKWGRMRYTKNRVWLRPLAGYCTYMVEDAFVALDYRCRGLLQISQGDLTQTARKPRAVFSYYCLFGCSICIYFKDLYADNRGSGLSFCT